MKHKLLSLYMIILLTFLDVGFSIGDEIINNSDISVLESNDGGYDISFSVIDDSNPDSINLVPFTESSKSPVNRYSNDQLPSEINNIIDYIDFQTDTSKKGMVLIYFTLPAETATVNQSRQIADFIMNRDEWKGDRSEDSIAAEIYIHWVADNAESLFQNNSFSRELWRQYIIGTDSERTSPVHPTHLGYYYAGLDKTNPMDAFLSTL